MKTKLNRAASLLVAASAMFLANTSHAEIVYRNNIGDLSTILNPGAFEVGDEIILGGTSRVLTNFTFQYTASFSGTRQAQLRFYLNDGPLSSGFSSPGTKFFDSGTFNIPTGNNNLTFDTDFGAGLLVPGRFTWSVQFFGLSGGDSAGPSLYNPVTVGNNFNDYWDYNGTSWTLRQSTNAVPINFGAQAEAVPEPSTMVLGAVGCLLAWGFTRRKR